MPYGDELLNFVPDLHTPDPLNESFDQDNDQNTEVTLSNPQNTQNKKLLPVMENFYEKITGSKKRKNKKELIIYRYHLLVLVKLNDPTLRDTNRDEFRSIKLYFIHFANHEISIISVINSLVNEDKINYQRDLKEYNASSSSSRQLRWEKS